MNTPKRPSPPIGAAPQAAQKRQGQFTNPPTHQTAAADKPTKGTEAATKAVEERLREFGQLV